eukprot:15470641-Alexandrium_andersonii.AAC.1
MHPRCPSAVLVLIAGRYGPNMAAAGFKPSAEPCRARERASANSMAELGPTCAKAEGERTLATVSASCPPPRT